MTITDPYLPPVRRFRLVRIDDVSGVSGTGVVALGVRLPDGQMVMQWVSKGLNSISIFRNEADLLEIHGHAGSSWIEWIDL